MVRVCVVAGARPNFMKVAPLIKELQYNKEAETFLVHTGQHYDYNMSKQFFDDLEIPEPGVFLGVGSGTHAQQTANIMTAFEKTLLEAKPDVVIVVGDVNSTIACALTAVKLSIKVAHIEAGLRSFDRTMPEEINRILTDVISDLLFVTEESAIENLIKEGIAKDKIYFVGNLMIDTLLKYKEKAERSGVLKRLCLTKVGKEAVGAEINGHVQPAEEDRNIVSYGVLTLHRPSNVDDKSSFIEIIAALKEIGQHIPIVFPCHPRTIKRINEFGIDKDFVSITNGNHTEIRKEGIYMMDPLGYLEFLHLMSKAKIVLTDSGGIQEETTILGVPCITIRDNTERPITVNSGTNKVVGTKRAAIIAGSLSAIYDTKRMPFSPPLWDGKAAGRTVNILLKAFHVNIH
jgi:UDP-N-acetylglucosamine 2-epimerase (non-hydrolysing)